MDRTFDVLKYLVVHFILQNPNMYTFIIDTSCALSNIFIHFTLNFFFVLINIG